MQRFYPNPTANISVADAYGEVRSRIAVDGSRTRPTIGLCMVMSIDGSTVVDGRSKALGSPSDLGVLIGLRNLADVIVVGANTARIDNYGPPSKPGLRVGVVTRRVTVDIKRPLFALGRGFLITTENAETPAGIDCIRAGRDTVDLVSAMCQLHGNYAQLEGGAALNAAMFEADLVDEINVTINPSIVGGSGLRLTAGAQDLTHRYNIAHVLEDDGFLFLRYLRQAR